MIQRSQCFALFSKLSHHRTQPQASPASLIQFTRSLRSTWTNRQKVSSFYLPVFFRIFNFIFAVMERAVLFKVLVIIAVFAAHVEAAGHPDDRPSRNSRPRQPPRQPRHEEPEEPERETELAEMEDREEERAVGPCQPVCVLGRHAIIREN